MKVISIAAAFVLSGLLAPPAASFAAQPLNMAVSLSPNPARQGAETITVMLTDATRKPVNGAHVSIATNMPTMSMGGPTVVALPKGNGRYAASLKIAFATRWAFTIVAKSGGRTVSRTITADIK